MKSSIPGSNFVRIWTCSLQIKVMSRLVKKFLWSPTQYVVVTYKIIRYFDNTKEYLKYLEVKILRILSRGKGEGDKRAPVSTSYQTGYLKRTSNMDLIQCEG